jgi:hypothetical protein
MSLAVFYIFVSFLYVFAELYVAWVCFVWFYFLLVFGIGHRGRLYPARSPVEQQSEQQCLEGSGQRTTWAQPGPVF